MKNNIVLDIDHPGKKRVEYFLNSAGEELEQISFDLQNSGLPNEIIAGFKFKSTDQRAFITVIFATSYFQANAIGISSAVKAIRNKNWTVNGDILFIVESKDESIIRKMLGHFAGEE